MKKSLYLLTGATGLLGSNLIRILLGKGYPVRVLVLPGDPAGDALPPEVEKTQGDVCDADSLTRFFAVPPDTGRVVIHAAAIVTLDPNPNEKVRRVNVEGTKNMVDMCVRHGVEKLVYISSTSAIPEPPRGQRIRETEHFDPEKVTGYYAKTKAMASALVMHAVEEHGLNASLVLPSGIFGPYDSGFGMITSSVKMVAEGRMPVSIGGTFSAVDVRDLAAGIVACAEKGVKGKSYIMAGSQFTFQELVQTICRNACIRAPGVSLPLWLLRPFAGIGSLYTRITNRPAWFSRFTVYNLERNNDFDATRAKTELGFTCRPMEETVADTITWLRETGNLRMETNQTAR